MHVGAVGVEVFTGLSWEGGHGDICMWGGYRSRSPDGRWHGKKAMGLYIYGGYGSTSPEGAAMKKRATRSMNIVQTCHSHYGLCERTLADDERLK
jgi:hypothetical protein